MRWQACHQENAGLKLSVFYSTPPSLGGNRLHGETHGTKFWPSWLSQEIIVRRVRGKHISETGERRN
jgi:hypothetical protein